jgi:hypothetical protein
MASGFSEKIDKKNAIGSIEIRRKITDSALAFNGKDLSTTLSA